MGLKFLKCALFLIPIGVMWRNNQFEPCTRRVRDISNGIPEIIDGSVTVGMDECKAVFGSSWKTKSKRLELIAKECSRCNEMFFVATPET